MYAGIAARRVRERARRVVLAERVDLRFDDLAHRRCVGGGYGLRTRDDRGEGEEEGAERVAHDA